MQSSVQSEFSNVSFLPPHRLPHQLHPPHTAHLARLQDAHSLFLSRMSQQALGLVGCLVLTLCASQRLPDHALHLVRCLGLTLSPSRSLPNPLSGHPIAKTEGRERNTHLPPIKLRGTHIFHQSGSEKHTAKSSTNQAETNTHLAYI